jgi:DNA topoisomerase-2
VGENEEINSLKKILGLQQYDDSGKRKIYHDLSELRYGHILILTDQDVDGSHIKGLVMNLFHSYWPSLLEVEGFIQTMATPIVKARHRQNLVTFYTLSEYKQWKESVTNAHLWDIKYYKGLGTSTSVEAKEYFGQIDQTIVNYIYETPNSDDAMHLAFDKSFADQRKDWLRQYDPNNIIEQTEKRVPIHDFVNRDLIHFSNYDNDRSIPSICDGLKPSQRKVLYSVLKRNLIREIKVAQLSGYVSEHSAYHHGEMSLNGTIIGLAHDFVGSNNINLLVPKGQFGTRIQGGKDSASPRYIFTLMNELTPIIYNSKDNALLQYQDEDSMKIEPVWYIPIIPMILVNGTDGVGTGFSTQMPCYNPMDIVNNILRLIRGDELQPMLPWYRGFKGTIFEKDNRIFSRGLYQVHDESTVEVTELPIGMWTDNYKIYLDDLVIDKSVDEKKKKSQCLLSYESHYTESTVRFILYFDPKILNPLDPSRLEDLEKILDIQSTKGTTITNMHLHNSRGGIVKYSSPEEILQEFFVIRLVYYQKRKEHLTKELEEDILFLRSKIRFVEGVITKTLDIYHKEDEEIEALLETNEFPRLGEPASYRYLIDMPIRSLTKRKVEELKKQLTDRERELADLLRKEVHELWMEDLEDFTRVYNKMIQEYDEAMSIAESGLSSSATGKKKLKKKFVPPVIESTPSALGSLIVELNSRKNDKQADHIMAAIIAKKKQEDVTKMQTVTVKKGKK